MVSMLDSSATRRKLLREHIAAEREAERERAQWFAQTEDARRNGFDWLLWEPDYVIEHREFRARQQQATPI
jgi:hypothetical protein